MDRDRDRDRSRGVKRPKTSSSSESSRHRDSGKTDEKTSHEEEKVIPINKKDLYEKVSKYEYEEAKRMNVNKVFEEYNATLARFKENAAEVLVMKHSPEGINEERKALLRMEGLNCVIKLRTINRLLKIRLKIAKDEQVAKRQEVDAEHLTLQNLLYEATNLQNQMAAVQGYKGMDEKIELIPVEQFYKEAPDKVAKPEATENNPHRLRIARLEYEFIQRQKLTEQCSTLEKEKESIGKKIEEKQTKLDNVRPLLNKMVEASLPLQEFFGLDVSAKKARYQVAKYLPAPLYVLFVQSEAYQEAEGGKQQFVIKIGGDVEAAKELVDTQEDDEEDSDAEKAERNQDGDTDISDRRKLRKRSSIGLSLDENRKRMFQKHPLWIEWIVRSRSNESVTIQFYYLVKLKVVTVKSRVHRDSSDGTTSVSITGTSDNVLTELFPNDCGLESPNPANYYLFNKFSITSLVSYLKETGKPYGWAQQACGLLFPELGTRDIDFEARATMDVSRKSLETTLRLIRRRLTNQAKLWNQLKALDSRNIQIPAGARERLPPKNSTNFISWELLDFETYSKYSFTEPLVVDGTVTAKDMFYKAVLQRGRAKMIALIAIGMDFPSVAPIFRIQLDMDGESRSSSTDSSVREIEKEVNVLTPVEFQDYSDVLVSIQLYRLMSCCDIILETDILMEESEGPAEFSREKLFLKSTAGRSERRPFEYVKQGGGYFTQRY